MSSTVGKRQPTVLQSAALISSPQSRCVFAHDFAQHLNAWLCLPSFQCPSLCVLSLCLHVVHVCVGVLCYPCGGFLCAVRRRWSLCMHSLRLPRKKSQHVRTHTLAPAAPWVGVPYCSFTFEQTQTITKHMQWHTHTLFLAQNTFGRLCVA
jgi:hypothetical protein